METKISETHLHDKCAKCGQTSLIEIQPTPSDYSRIVSGTRVLHSIIVTKYVCTDCGHVEQWVNSRKDLVRLKGDLKEVNDGRKSEGELSAGV